MSLKNNLDNRSDCLESKDGGGETTVGDVVSMDLLAESPHQPGVVDNEQPPPLDVDIDDLATQVGISVSGRSEGSEVVASGTVSEVVGADLGRGKRIKSPFVKLKDYVTNTVQTICPSSPSSSQTSGTPYPLANSINCNHFSTRHRSFLATLTVGTEPKSFKEAMQKEIATLEDNGSWSVVELPKGKKALGAQWVYKVKLNSDGTIERFKAHLVAFGNHQVEGIDYNNTFVPVAKMITVRTVLAVTSVRN
ncbi:transmembrane signal receptor [Lithospermum erythrorhizon]|uniref:Transmembrane signal receptor n=1 Tax=Lithospermum erythrorhizon TaxID=34254 RepID=A0AAV3QPB4_LITER